MLPRGRANSANNPSNDSNLMASLIDNLRTQLSVQPQQTQQKWMHVRIGSSAKERRVAWYAPCESAALDAVLRAACSIPADRQYLLLDATMSAVAISSSLPSGQTFELVRARKVCRPSPSDRVRA